MNFPIQYRITTWKNYDDTWSFVISKYMHVTFKRSKRQGWHGCGFVRTAHDNRRFANRAEALACAQFARRELEDRK
jgi:hypothetical protein